MARGLHWTADEDAAILAAAAENREDGIVRWRPGARLPGDYANRLREVAEDLGRTYAAVRKRAERIGATSYRKGEAE